MLTRHHTPSVYQWETKWDHQYNKPVDETFPEAYSESPENCCTKCEEGGGVWTNVGHWDVNSKKCRCFKVNNFDRYKHKGNKWCAFRCDYRFADNSCEGGGCPGGTWSRKRRDLAGFKLSGKKFECETGWQTINSSEACEDAANFLDQNFVHQNIPLGARPGCVSLDGQVYFSISNGSAGRLICQVNTDRIYRQIEGKTTTEETPTSPGRKKRQSRWWL